MEPGHVVVQDRISADGGLARAQPYTSPFLPQLAGTDDRRPPGMSLLPQSRIPGLPQSGRAPARAQLGQEAERLLAEVDRMLEAHKQPRLRIRVQPEPWWRRLLRRAFAVRRTSRSIALQPKR